jgi:AraC family transcriptional regulator
MEALIVDMPMLRLIGMAVQVTLNDVQMNKTTVQLSSQFLKRKADISNGLNDRVMYGVSTDPENYSQDTDPFEFFIGIEVTSDEDIPVGMVYRELPANTYVLFTYQGHYYNAGAVHDYLYTRWLTDNGCELAGPYNIEIYDERNHGPESEDSLTDLCFPVRLRA